MLGGGLEVEVALERAVLENLAVQAGSQVKLVDTYYPRT